MEAWFYGSMSLEPSESEVSRESSETDEDDVVMSDEDIEAWWEKEAIKSLEEEIQETTYRVVVYEGTDLIVD